MSNTLQNLVKEKLCQNGVWEISDAMKLVLNSLYMPAGTRKETWSLSIH